MKWLLHGLNNFPWLHLLFYSLPAVYIVQNKFEPTSQNQHLKPVYEDDWDSRLDKLRRGFVQFLREMKCPFIFVTDKEALDNGMLEIREYKRPDIIGSGDVYLGNSEILKKLWRYFSLNKFLSLLRTESIWFSRPQYFDDPHEFTMDVCSQRELFQWKLDSFTREYNKAKISNRDSFILNATPLIVGLPLDGNGLIKKGEVKLSNLSEILLSSIKRDIQLWQESFCISCWRYSAFDSVAVWNQYASLEEGIAIVAEVDELRASLRKFGDIRLEIVKYVDFSSNKYGPMRSNPLGYKDIRYEAESEARFYFRAAKESGLRGIEVPFKISEVIKEIRLAPNATGWFKKNIECLLKKYKLTIPVVESSLGQAPNKF